MNKVTQNNSMNTKLEMFCVFFVDMENSTHTTAQLRPEKYALYYTVFYDKLSEIAKRFNGRVIKHVGDALLIYFPATADPSNREAFKTVIDCAMAMIGARCMINNTFHKEKLPMLSYRISADYGRMESIETETSATLDWIGPSMNMVAKINHVAPPNTMVIGGDLQQILTKFSFNEYLFEQAGELDIGIKQKYPVYSVTMNTGNYQVISNSLSNGPPSTLSLDKKYRPQTALDQSAAFPRVLIVDDEHDILLVYKQFLSDQPVNVDVFADPLQLLGHLALVGPTYYDVAIIDIKMPKMSGIQVYQVLAALKPSIKTLFVSAFDFTDEVLSTLRRLGKEEDFIRKPVNRENFVGAVSKKLESLYTPTDVLTCTMPPSSEILDP